MSDKLKTFSYKIFNIVFFSSFLLITIQSFFSNNNIYGKRNILYMFLCTVIILIIWCFLYKLSSKFFTNISLKKELFFVITFFIVLTLTQLFIGNKLKVTPSWDFGEIYKSAEVIAKHENFNNYIWYFKAYPNNIYSLLILTFIFKLFTFFNLSNFYLAGIIINVLLINISIAFLYLTIRKLYGTNNAILSLFIVPFFSSFTLYTPIFYSDTFSMLFPIALIYFYLVLSDKNSTKKARNVCLLIIPIIMFFGINIKFSVIITCIGILIDYLLNYKNFRILEITKTIATILIIFILLYLIMNNILKRINLDHANVKEVKQPYTHWIMMGLKEPYGGFNEEDFELTFSIQSQEEAKQANINETKQRLKNYGIINYIKFLVNKANFTWGDGSYFASVKLSRQPINSENTYLSKWFLIDGDYFSIYYYIAQGVQYSFLLLMLLGTYYTIINNEYNELNLVKVSLFGVLIFFLIWETRSRYLTNYTPLFILSIIPVMNKYDHFIKKVFGKETN